ncbi:MAG: ATP synthase F0 subunit B [Trichlorobacter sp.]|nr:ATP synthase F0 subunit B [Trichlorobacter sp.]
MLNACHTRKRVALLVLAASVLSASAAFASGHADSGAVMKDFIWRVINFAVLIAIVVWGLKKANLKGSLADRQANIEKNLNEARAARDAAEAKLREYTDKIDKANLEIEQLRAGMMQDAELEKQRIIKEANEAALKITNQASQSAEQEVIKARVVLQAEAARLAVELASGKLSAAVQKADHDRFVQDYLGKVGQL